MLAELAGALAPAVQAARLRADLQHSRERLVVAREEERRRLRRDLHDGLGPALAGLTLKLDAARNRLGDDPLLREMRGDVQATIADVRRLVDGLRPVPLDELGLTEALRRLVDGAPAGGPAVRLVTDGAESPAAAVEVAAYRIVQEALTNVLRHSGAGSCEVSVCARERLARGQRRRRRPRARTPSRAAASGLETMRERAEELGGSLELRTRAGGGTRGPRRPAEEPVVIGVLVVDDHPLFRGGVQSLLDSVPDIEVVATAADGEAAVREATLARPDVVLMDLTMPGMGGLEATRRIVRACPGTAVLVLSMLDDDESVLAAMRAGARGYVPKGAGQEELLAAIRAVATGGAVFGAGVAGRMLASLDRSPAPAFPGLTERESEVLTLMAEGMGQPGDRRASCR